MSGEKEGKILKKASGSNVASAKEVGTKKLDKKSQKPHRFSYADIDDADNDKDFTSSSDSNRGKKKESKEEHPATE